MAHRFNQLKGIVDPEDICLDCGIKRNGSLGIECLTQEEKVEKMRSANEDQGNGNSYHADADDVIFGSSRSEANTEFGRLVTNHLREMADLFEKRNAVYKDNYRMVGRIMAVLFPEGLTLKTEDDFNKFHLYMLAIVKQSRYAINYVKGHTDSLDDEIVYLSMVNALDSLKDNNG